MGERLLITSMTGYGRATQLLAEREITVEIKSVNHRYFEFSSRTPRSVGYMEEKLKRLVGEKVSRGKIDLNLTIVNASENAVTAEINIPLAKSYLDALRGMGERLEIADDIRVSTLARFGDIFSVKKEEADEEILWQAVRTVTEEALNAFIGMRQTEGTKLLQDISARLDLIGGYADKVDEVNPKTVDKYREKLTQRLTELLADRNIDDARIITEAAIFSEKTAVAEETVRLRSHLAQMRTFLSEDGATGRKMDFLVQEMNREANTIGSKAQDSEIQYIVVELKSEIEKIREQVQNIE